MIFCRYSGVRENIYYNISLSKIRIRKAYHIDSSLLATAMETYTIESNNLSIILEVHGKICKVQQVMMLFRKFLHHYQMKSIGKTDFSHFLTQSSSVQSALYIM